MDPKKYLSMEDAIKILNNIIEDYNNQYKSNVLNIDVVALQKLIEEYSNLKQIEEAHRTENGKLREKLKQELEKRRKLTQCHLRYEEMTGIDLLLEE